MNGSVKMTKQGPFGESETEWMQRLEDDWLAEGLDAATDADRALDEEREDAE